MTETSPVIRNFFYNGLKLPDPNPRMTVDEVRAFYSNRFADLTNATTNGPKIEGDELHYEFVRAIGQKG
jgi:PRTRC genetic system protein C